MKSKTAEFIFFITLLIHGTSSANEAPTSLANDTWQKLNTLVGVKVGTTSNDIVQLIVLFDANCPFSAKLWSHIYGNGSPHQKIASLWAPVTYLDKDSAGKAASLLKIDSAAALSHNFEQFDFKYRSGAARPIEVTATMRQALNRNSEAWKKIMGATPLLIYKVNNGQIFLQAGYPSTAIINDLLSNLAPSTLRQYSR